MSASAVPRLFPQDLRRSAEFAAPPDDGAIQQAAVGQILEQGRHSFVHFRQFPAHDLKMLFVRVPAFVVDGDVRDAVFDQPPRHQARLPERVAAVAFSQIVFLLGEIEQFARVAQNQVVRLFLGLGQGLDRRHRLSRHARRCSTCGAIRGGRVAAGR